MFPIDENWNHYRPRWMLVFEFFFKKKCRKINPPKALENQDVLRNNLLFTTTFNELLTIKYPIYTHKVLTA